MPLVERMRPLLGTFVTIQAEGDAEFPAQQVESAVESAFQAIVQVDKLMSFHRRSSDIGHLNRARPGSILRVHRWTFHVLQEALQLWRWSEGAFDCNVGGALIRAGLLPKKILGCPRHRNSRGEAIRLYGNRSVRLNSRVAIDLGGIAKGFAVDQAISALRAYGVTRGLVNAGGDLRVFGEHMHAVWARCPEDPTRARLLGTLANGAVATSGAYFTQARRTGEIANSAIVRTGLDRLVRMSGSVSVVAKNCLLADALTKVVVLNGRLSTRLARYAQARVVTL